MKAVNLIFPHQLFEVSPLITNGFPTYLVEEYLFFQQYPFHKQKIAFHRATMKNYATYLLSKGVQVQYIEAIQPISDVQLLIGHLAKQEIQTIHYIDPTDNWLSKRLNKKAAQFQIKTIQYDSPLFLNTPKDLATFFKPTKKKFFQTTFYQQQRVIRNILLEDNGKPVGGKWSFDAANRKKYPKKKLPPPISYPMVEEFYKEACLYVKQHYPNNPGQLSGSPFYPTNFKTARLWFNQFLQNRFLEFGPYEDAIVAEYAILNHSVLTPMLNTGLVTPKEILASTLKFIQENEIPINSSEGFIRQIIGWREFIRGVYECKGSEERTTNFWKFKRKIPGSFYDGTTGILPIDQTIKKVLKTGYCHHIERLMVLGNFMLLCEFDPDEVYQWFMELFIDAYDWVMVPNVYGMSQFADGGLMSTKPYISGSNYLMKMSNYPKGDWQQIWDGLFWRFMHVHRDFFTKNPRLGMLVRMFDKMPQEKKDSHLKNAETYLEKL